MGSESDVVKAAQVAVERGRRAGELLEAVQEARANECEAREALKTAEAALSKFLASNDPRQERLPLETPPEAPVETLKPSDDEDDTLVVKRSDWQKYQRELLDADGLIFHGEWQPEGANRVLYTVGFDARDVAPVRAAIERLGLKAAPPPRARPAPTPAPALATLHGDDPAQLASQCRDYALAIETNEGAWEVKPIKKKTEAHKAFDAQVAAYPGYRARLYLQGGQVKSNEQPKTVQP